MCGFFLTNGDVNELELEGILSRRLAFRGPDFQSGVVNHEGWKIYHSRLSIIATSHAYAQPFFTNTGGVLVFNGEILNYESLASKYGLQSATSDTEVLGALLEINKFDLNEIDGFFSFAYVDSAGNLKFCARDRFGVKPLNYIKRGGAISISSEASVLSDLYNLPYCAEAIEEYKVFRFPLLSGTYFKDVDPVPPGECLITGRFFESTDYIPEYFENASSLIPELRETIGKSIKTRLISDVPVGLLYSGGVDSNLISSRLDPDFPRFTGGLHDGYDLDHARANESGNSFIVDVSDELFLTRLREMISLRKEPISVPNEVILSILADRWAHIGGKVLLSGEAADELFAGYDRVFYWALNAEKFDLPHFLKMYAYVDPQSISPRIFDELRHFFEQLNGLTPFEKVRQFFVKMHLPILFRRLDFSLMYSGIEGREPLATLDMYKLALRFRAEDLFKGKLGKLPLRTISAEDMGEEFAFRDKVGFPVDTRKLLTGTSSVSRVDNYESWFSFNLEMIS